MADIADGLEEEIVTEIGKPLPDAVSRYTDIDPHLFRAYRAFRSALLDSGELPRKYKLLMAISILTATKQGDAMDMYASIARKEGATAQELLEALRVGVLFSGGPGIAAAAATAATYGLDNP
jgi:alkylhydroperoxidase/carboxymuconolactone decarboxylase family protein YurZ